MNFFDIFKRKQKPCPPIQQQQIDSMTKVLDDTHTKVDFLENLLNANGFNRLMIVKKKDKKDGLNSPTLRNPYGC